VVEFLVCFHWLEERDAGNRNALGAAAAMTVLRAWHIAGKPRQSHPLGTFTEWPRRIREPLIWLGRADPAPRWNRSANVTP